MNILFTWILTATIFNVPHKNTNFDLIISDRLTIDALYLARGTRVPTQGVFMTLAQVNRIKGEVSSKQDTYSQLIAELEQVCESSLAEHQRVCRAQQSTLTVRIDALENDVASANNRTVKVKQRLSTLQNKYKYFRIGAYITTGLLTSALVYTALR